MKIALNSPAIRLRIEESGRHAAEIYVTSAKGFTPSKHLIRAWVKLDDRYAGVAYVWFSDEHGQMYQLSHRLELHGNTLTYYPGGHLSLAELLRRARTMGLREWHRKARS